MKASIALLADIETEDSEENACSSQNSQRDGML